MNLWDFLWFSMLVWQMFFSCWKWREFISLYKVLNLWKTSYYILLSVCNVFFIRSFVYFGFVLFWFVCLFVVFCFVFCICIFFCIILKSHFLICGFIDIDECKGNHSCHENANCTNTNGSHVCDCQPGYTGNGQNCTGKFGIARKCGHGWFILVRSFLFCIYNVFCVPVGKPRAVYSVCFR